jgi:hypothetical protein
VTHFDLANNYGPPPGAAEELLGRMLKDDFATHRDELFIASKAGYDMWDGPYGSWGSRKHLMASLDQSLKRMQLDYVDKENIGAMGNSLGGGSVMYITAFDERIKSAVISTGISPYYSNTYRAIDRKEGEYMDPQVFDDLKKDGKAPWDLHEILSMCAPRAILCLEPFNDPYNPYVAEAFGCIHSAWQVYNLLEKPENCAAYIHGDGHDTVDDVRDMSYKWLEKYLKH